MKNSTKKYLLSTLALSTAFCGLLGVKALGAKADETNPFDSFAIESEAEVRTEAPVGIRFVTMVNADQLAAAEEFGTLVIPKTLLDGELEIDTENAAKIVAEKWLDEEKSGYTGVIVGEKNGEDFTDLPEEFYDDVLVARSYAIVDGVAVYSENVVEQSIAQVAAISLNAGEQSKFLQEIVDYVLGQDFAFAKTEISLTVDAEPTAVALESKGLAVVLENSNPNVASYVNGKITALNAGETTITAKIGEKTTSLKVTVDLPALEGTKVMSWNADTIAENVAQVKDGDGNGACDVAYDAETKVLGAGTLKIKSTSYYARFRDTLSNFPLNMQYEKFVFYVYTGNTNQELNDSIALTQNAWTKVEIAAPATNYLQVSFNDIDWGQNKTAEFYISEIYGVGATGFAKIVDFSAANGATALTQKSGGGTPAFSTDRALAGEDGTMLVSVPNATTYGRVNFTGAEILMQYQLAQTVYGYQKLAFAVYLDTTGSTRTATQMVKFKGVSTNLTRNGWTWITMDAPADLSGNMDLTDSDYWQSTGMKFYISDFYAYNPSKDGSSKVADLSENNYANVIMANNSGNSSLGYENGYMICKFSSYSENCSMNLKITADIDVSEYSQVVFAVYDHNNVVKNFTVGGTATSKATTMTQGGWTFITIDVSALTTLNGVTFNIKDGGYGGMANFKYSFTSIYGIK